MNKLAMANNIACALTNLDQFMQGHPMKDNETPLDKDDVESLFKDMNELYIQEGQEECPWEEYPALKKFVEGT